MLDERCKVMCAFCTCAKWCGYVRQSSQVQRASLAMSSRRSTVIWLATQPMTRPCCLMMVRHSKRPLSTCVRTRKPAPSLGAIMWCSPRSLCLNFLAELTCLARRKLCARWIKRFARACHGFSTGSFTIMTMSAIGSWSPTMILARPSMRCWRNWGWNPRSSHSGLRKFRNSTAKWLRNRLQHRLLLRHRFRLRGRRLNRRRRRSWLRSLSARARWRAIGPTSAQPISWSTRLSLRWVRSSTSRTCFS